MSDLWQFWPVVFVIAFGLYAYLLRQIEKKVVRFFKEAITDILDDPVVKTLLKCFYIASILLPLYAERRTPAYDDDW